MKALPSIIVIFSLTGLLYAAPVPDFVELCAQIKPAVVNIHTVKIRPTSNRHNSPSSPFGDNDPFREFFDRFFNEAPNGTPSRERSLGSGFIISDDGYILTTYQIIRNVGEINVRLANGHSYKGMVTGSNEKLDIAMIKISAPKEKLSVVKMGDSEKVQVGEWAIAIGNPFGLEHTVTFGFVSAKEQVIDVEPYSNLIQTDAAINPGNSGGPLFNARGEVVGINTALIRSSQGIGFAIPINAVLNILPELKGHGWLGVAVQIVTPELAQSFGLKEAQGVLVVEVVKGSPAEKCGIQDGDIILSFDGKDVNMLNNLQQLVTDQAVGKEVPIVVLRDSEKKTLIATLAQSPDNKEGDGDINASPTSLLGLQVEDITPDKARFYRLKEGETGALVIRAGGVAAEHGIRAGDLVQRINNTFIINAASFTQTVKKLKKGQIVRLLVRGGDNLRRYIAIRVE